MYALGVQGTATTATLNVCCGALWNPHATKSITLVLLSLSKIQGASNLYWCRTTTRGTPGSTVTPDIDNDLDRLLAPVSGVVFDTGHSVQPTRDASELWRNASSNNPGTTDEMWADGFRIPAGTGLGYFTSTATIAEFIFSFVWDEG